MQSTLGHYSTLRGGHAQGHLRDAFIEAVEAIEQWELGEPEPVVLVGHAQEEWPVSKVLRTMWNCTDIMPEMLRQSIDDMLPYLCGLKRRTYAAGSRALLAHVVRSDAK